MRGGTLALVAVACAVLIGCGSKPYYFDLHPRYVDNPFAKKVRCDNNQCALTVTVNDCANGANGGIVVTDAMANGPDLDISHGDPRATRTITWTIATAGYEFANDPFKYGILIKSDQADEFTNPRVTNGTQLSIDYKKAPKSPGNYTYGLQLRSTSGNKDYCGLLDPWLIT